MSYYKPKGIRSKGQGGSFIQGSDDQKGASSQRAMCATCGHPFRKGERVFWRTHMSPSRMYQPVKVGVCRDCERDQGDIQDEVRFENERKAGEREALKQAQKREDAKPDWRQRGNEEYRQNIQKQYKGRKR